MPESHTWSLPGRQDGGKPTAGWGGLAHQFSQPRWPWCETEVPQKGHLGRERRTLRSFH